MASNGSHNGCGCRDLSSAPAALVDAPAERSADAAVLVDPPAMPDVQASADARRIAIDRVGVKGVTHPLTLRTREGGVQTSVARINMYVALPHDRKGTHMSRFVEVLGEFRHKPLRPDDMEGIASELCRRLDAHEATFEASFTYFIEKLAPVSRQASLMDYEVTIACTALGTGEVDSVLTVAAPATSLCPCSKEISIYGAHNQRCRIEASVRTDGPMWIEQLVELLESAASHPVYSLLKRPDEKHVTEKAYENPKFVEDIVRDLAVALDGEPRIRSYRISSENFESIHSHNAYAELARTRR